MVFDIIAAVVTLVAVGVGAWFLSGYLAKVFTGERVWLSPVVRPVERGFYRLSGIKEDEEQNWVLYLLLPISIVGAIFLASQGVVQNLNGYTVVHTLQGAQQTIAQGPVASQEVIKDLGNNGGGPFNANSSHPYENPNGLTNQFEIF